MRHLYTPLPTHERRWQQHCGRCARAVPNLNSIWPELLLCVVPFAPMQLLKDSKLSTDSAATLKATYETMIENLKESHAREQVDLQRAKILKEKLQVC